jgi:tRNA threonylcarbamoyladenosine biosynthesis protein TsaB
MSLGRFTREAHYVALDTSGPVGYVAISRGPEVLARARLDSEWHHASTLVPAIRNCLESASVSLGELAGVAVGEGPGSFTGVRVAAATAKGLARGLGVPLWAVSSLAAAAVSDLGRAGPGIRYVLFDARADRVYAACYGVGSATIETLVPPHAGDLRSVLADDVPAGAAFVGDAAERHRRAIEGAGYSVLGSPLGEPTAEALIYYLAGHVDAAPVPSLGTWEPRYLKPSNAEREWIA